MNRSAINEHRGLDPAKQLAHFLLLLYVPVLKLITNFLEKFYVLIGFVPFADGARAIDLHPWVKLHKFVIGLRKQLFCVGQVLSCLRDPCGRGCAP